MNPPRHRGHEIRKINAIAQAQLIRLMLDGTMSCEELAEETGLHYVTVLQYTRELYRAGACHVAGYAEDALGKRSVRLYKIGAARDARRPPRLTSAQRQERYRRRQRDVALLGLKASSAA